MGKLLSPSIPKEDPSVTRIRDAEQRRAEEDRLRSTQEQLSVETRLRDRTTGLRSLFGALSGGNRIRSLLGAG